SRLSSFRGLPSDALSSVCRSMMVLVVILVLAALAALAVWLKKELDQLRAAAGQQLSVQLSERNADVDRRLAGLVETMDRRLGELDRRGDHPVQRAGRKGAAPS